MVIALMEIMYNFAADNYNDTTKRNQTNKKTYDIMQIIKDKQFGGERPLFASHDLHIDNVLITEGESAIKECSNIKATNCRFEGNYPSGMSMGLK